METLTAIIVITIFCFALSVATLACLFEYSRMSKKDKSETVFPIVCTVVFLMMFLLYLIFQLLSTDIVNAFKHKEAINDMYEQCENKIEREYEQCEIRIDYVVKEK